MNKITCNVIKDILPLYIDGVVSEDTQKIVEEHLEECSLCRDEINKLKKTLVIPTNTTRDCQYIGKKYFFYRKNYSKKNHTLFIVF